MRWIISHKRLLNKWIWRLSIEIRVGRCCIQQMKCHTKKTKQTQTLAGLRLTNTDDEALVPSGHTHKCTNRCWLWGATWMQAIHGAIYVEWGCPQSWDSNFKSNIYFTVCQGSVPPFRAFTWVASGKTSRHRLDEWGTDEPQSVFWNMDQVVLLWCVLQHAN